MIADTTDCTRENNLKEITQPDKSGDEAYTKVSGNFWLRYFLARPRVASPTKTKAKQKLSKRNNNRERYGQQRHQQRGEEKNYFQFV